MTGKRYTDPDATERGVVLQVLRADHADRWSRAEPERELHGVEPSAIGDALEQRKTGAVVHLKGEQVRASKWAQYLNALGMVSK
jgi:hypothetical protein